MAELANDSAATRSLEAETTLGDEARRMAAELGAARFSWARRVGKDATKSLCGDALQQAPCADGCSCIGGCVECEDQEDRSKQTAAATNDDEASDEALLAKFREARMGEIVRARNPAESAPASLRKELGTHKRLREHESLESLLEDSASIPIVLHVGVVTNDESVDNNLVLVVAEEMMRAADTFARTARLVTDVCISRDDLPAWLQAKTLPALVTLRHRAVSAALPERLDSLPEKLLRETVRRWLASERARLLRDWTQKAAGLGRFSKG